MREHVFVILRISKDACSGGAFDEMGLRVPKLLRTLERAQAEVARLNQLNGAKGIRYFHIVGRLEPEEEGRDGPLRDLRAGGSLPIGPSDDVFVILRADKPCSAGEFRQEHVAVAKLVRTIERAREEVARLNELYRSSQETYRSLVSRLETDSTTSNPQSD